MYREVSKLILYRDLGEDSILLNMADIFKRFDSCHYRADCRINHRHLQRNESAFRILRLHMDLTRTYGTIT